MNNFLAIDTHLQLLLKSGNISNNHLTTNHNLLIFVHDGVGFW